MKPKKSLGQNFLINQGAIKSIVSAVTSGNPDLIIEIGPGKGAITKELKKITDNIVVIEKDNRFISLLEEIGVEVILDDVLKVDIMKIIALNQSKNIVIVGNLPYNISTVILFKLLNDFKDLNKDSKIKFILMFQKEVADRILSQENIKQYGIISIVTQAQSNIKKVLHLSSGSFFPQPKICSTVIEITPCQKVKSIANLTLIVSSLFKYRRKTISNIYNNYINEEAQRLLHSLRFSNLRPENISIKKYIELADEIL